MSMPISTATLLIQQVHPIIAGSAMQLLLENTLIVQDFPSLKLRLESCA